MKTANLKKYLTDRNINYLLIFIGIVFLLAELKRVSDFGIFLQASADLLEGKNIYQVKYGDGFRYYYSPFFALLISPLTFLPNFIAASLWSLLSLLLFIRTLHLLHGFVTHKTDSGKLNILTIIASVTLIYANFHNNQMSAFILWTMIEAIEQVRKGKWVLGGTILALGINIKLLPLVLLPYLLYRTRFKSALFTVLAMIGFWVLPSLVIGWDYNLALLNSYWNYIDPSLNQNVFDIEEPGLMSLSSLVTTWFTDQFSVNEIGYRRHIAILPEEWIGRIILIFRLFFVSLSLYFLKWPPFTKARSNEHLLWEISYLCLVTPLIFPHQQNYGFFLIIPAIFYSIFIFRSNSLKYKKWTLGLFITSLLFLNMELILGAYKKVFWNFKILTYGVLMLVFVISQLDPTKKHAKR